MRISFLSALVVALAADRAVASTWFAKAAYNKWHQTELERWLSDHDVPYPQPADRKDLENLVKENWDANVATPYQSWDTNRLQSYLTSRGKEVKKGTEQNKDSLISQVQQSWQETGDQATDSYNHVKDWIFDTWTDSQLKAFLDYHHIPNPTPRTRDSLLKTVRENYSKAADKAGEAASYPGDWIYQNWSESDLKRWLDERGVPVPQPSQRDKLVASVRRNARIASQQYQAALASVSDSASAAHQTLTDALLDAWSDTQLKEWCDANGIKVPQGTKRNELIALARKHRSKLLSDYSSAASSASASLGAATSSAGNQFARASDDASLYGADLRDTVNDWFVWAKEQVGLAPSGAAASARSAAEAARSSAARGTRTALKDGAKVTDRVAEAYSSATDRVKEEL
ncbi:MAG: hypothetical protein M1822_009626 [Bathelium mastoideum]|nr:MAG: hypothetical protein M1822_009626 [Bathelium mastoideum]